MSVERDKYGRTPEQRSHSGRLRAVLVRLAGCGLWLTPCIDSFRLMAAIFAPTAPGDHVYRLHLKAANGKYLSVEPSHLIVAKSELGQSHRNRFPGAAMGALVRNASAVCV